MNCYHCQSRVATLKCEGCDSNIFRFCSQSCGNEALVEHAAACYQRNDATHVEEHLYKAIAEMEDREEIEDALDVAADLKSGDVDAEVLREAHEIIQAHLEDNGFVRIEAMTDTEKAERDARRAAQAEESARKRQERLDSLERARLARGDKAMTSAEKRAARQKRRAARREARAQRILQRGARRKSAAQKPGLRERWHAWRKGHDEKRAAKYRGAAKDDLDKAEK